MSLDIFHSEHLRNILRDRSTSQFTSFLIRALWVNCCLCSALALFGCGIRTAQDAGAAKTEPAERASTSSATALAVGDRAHGPKTKQMPGAQELPRRALEGAGPPVRAGSRATTAFIAATFEECGFREPPPPQVHIRGLRRGALDEPVCVAMLYPAPRTASDGGDVALVVLLHGLDATAADWFYQAHLSEWLQLDQPTRRLARALIVIPTGGDGYWTNWTDGQHNYGDMVLELVGAARDELGAGHSPARTAIAGYSAGGFGALALGLAHPERFGHVVALSPTDMELAIEASPARKLYRSIWGDPYDLGAVRAANPRRRIEAGAGAGQRFALVWGSAEPRKFAEGAVRLERAMKQRGLDVAARIVAGGRHSYRSTWGPESHAWWVSWLEEGIAPSAGSYRAPAPSAEHRLEGEAGKEAGP